MNGREDELLREGARLFEEQRFFEAHEVWETAWRGAAGSAKELFQGLVQVAAACHHLQQGHHRQAHTLLGRAQRHLRAARRAPLPANLLAMPGAVACLEEVLSPQGPAGEASWPERPTKG